MPINAVEVQCGEVEVVQALHSADQVIDHRGGEQPQQLLALLTDLDVIVLEHGVQRGGIEHVL